MVNLIARLPGRRSDRILLTGHYDTKLMAGARFVGASDGGSSAAWLIEAARVLALRRDREFTYEIVWLDGEEATCFGLDRVRIPDGARQHLRQPALRRTPRARPSRGRHARRRSSST